MSEPSVDPSWIQSAWQWMAAIGGSLFTGWKYVDAKLEKKADADDVKTCLRHIEQLYKDNERDRERAAKDKEDMRDFHDEAMRTINSQNTEILRAMTQCGLRNGQ